ncbi:MULTISPECIES: CDGSH iron-sulfur domain-containing protein [Mesorhizobium]|uniref:CDGSH iron-sulfur domain-containing protein n=2 Tax=Phyllobacteriaceae TaxID=69277 RepID=UPI000FCA0176|nr:MULTISPECIES: CDGSH iron-sulfur domain-containing protein [Mesorhizobium]RVB42289.1 iron-binding protein [Mesorhizobium sp. M7A.F.Ca.CA.004.05.1.1]AZV18797.1 iron-binding protein [Mesorhizobium sp. M7A.F.Ce.TU.012.03.2.1]MCF6124531.1 CDGSH iron-sulfur domain-containing protein [Mesorhizobium ciceri]MCQ8814381.1 CDGSH iron-sulfur domain-containing protein [Mesorhizobium sp. SEMIA396]MCQ8876009.1 CDGSH iron-sulfur domain-containing protein [Mesorhizobium sp. LMG17149]
MAGMVESDKIDVGFSGKRCIHSRNCVLGDPHVFVPNAPGQWIHPEAASVEKIVAIAESCPSGAITYVRKDGGPQEQSPVVNTVRLRENGPLAVHAEIVLDGETSYRATLCRCGASENKPFCDGSHNKSGFAATGEPPLKDTLALEARNGPLKVTPTTNGPLKLEGNLEIVTGTGHTVDRTQRAFLCRCGHSANKPFCDGTHKKVGFVG